MFSALTEAERQKFLLQSADSYIPGYTGHCPTLRFHYGRAYGSKTREILKELRSKRFREDATREKYREKDYSLEVLKPIKKQNDIARDNSLDFRYRAPRYVTGYTGFIPSLNFQYGKPYGRAADDSMNEFVNKQRRIREAEETNKMCRSQSAPKRIPVRPDNDVRKAMDEYIERVRYRGKPVSPESPPIAGYTGHIPRVRISEESLSQPYNTVAKKGLSLLQQEREKRKYMNKVQNRISDIIDDVEKKSCEKVI